MIHKQRLKKLQSQLKKQPFDALIIEDHTDLFYLTGLTLSAGTLFVDSKDAELIVDGRYIELCEQHSPFPVSLNLPLDSLIKKKKIKTLAFTQENTTYQRYQTLSKLKTTLAPINNLVADLRLIKNKEEIKCLRDAAALGCAGLDFLLKHLKEGVTEKELACGLDIFWKQKKSHSLAFDPIIAFGPGSSIPHYATGDVPLKKRDTVQLDIGVNLNHYNSDMSRVVFFGKPKESILKIYDIVLEAQLKALKLCKPGVSLKELDDAARSYITSKGYGKKFNHSLGHGIGLNVHEKPSIRGTGPDTELLLKKGMAITIEPGIYLPGVGGVRIEDTIVITEDGYENLSTSSKDLLVI